MLCVVQCVGEPTEKDEKSQRCHSGRFTGRFCSDFRGDGVQSIAVDGRSLRGLPLLERQLRPQLLPPARLLADVHLGPVDDIVIRVANYACAQSPHLHQHGLYWLLLLYYIIIC